mmetsp:Transcript_26390/g.39987  ORF Transcript_26390/g.39987 Transcript_26390/m.39987 type:complete len:370 (+) Transcript_26390:241-1350(+)|eukprot:CAMPEP_0178909760 /NCGR_PEP_ID=MMETSP0786-20121207/8714_1 /TAXON_ID=186022 /ORGANISM="Thalassionema frauenfeldii, Strain CCMP 1798" /LENGTH=369 /DNA_ID=CAMNT_0020581923 /DNA_START=174 /DNA_END=1283 /DNA_ORIENTATION=-
MLLVLDDHCNEAMSSEDGVNEATAALKGMLGIGGDSVTQTPKKKEKKETNAKGKGGKNNKSRPGSASKRNKTPSKNESGKGKKRNNKQPQKENFAWSAFQASPDASALPIPAFASPDSSRKLNETAKQLDEKKLSKLSIAVDQRDPVAPDPIDISKAPRAEDLEAQVIAEAEKAAGNITKSNQPTSDCKEKEATKSDETLIEVSDSGVNLAALASPLSIKETREGDLSHGAHGASTLPIQNDALPSTPFSSPNQTSTAPYQSPGAMQQQQQIHNAYMQPSMGYVTIQVQVPPVLMPDRRMVVTSPAGYPVQIVVPEGVPPGMIIPVHVPTAPLIQSPYGNYGQQLQQQVPYDMHHQYHRQQEKLDPKKR